MPPQSTYAARLAAIEHRLAQATPGPWAAFGLGEGYPAQVLSARIVEGRAMLVGVFPLAADAAFMAHAREDVEWLVARVRALESEGARF